MKGFHGKEKLSKVSLVYVVAPAVILFSLYFHLPISPYSELALGSAIVIWCIAASIATWRCAFNTQFQALGYIARLVPVVLVVVLLTNLSNIIFTAMGLATFGAP